MSKFSEKIVFYLPTWGLAGADPELDFGAIIQNWNLAEDTSFSCEKFLNTIVCYRKHCRFGGHGPPLPLIPPLGGSMFRQGI